MLLLSKAKYLKTLKRPYPGYNVLYRRNNVKEQMNLYRKFSDSGNSKFHELFYILGAKLKPDNEIVRFSCIKWETTPIAHRVISIFDLNLLTSEEISASFDKIFPNSVSIDKFVMKPFIMNSDLYHLSQKQVDDFVDLIFNENETITKQQYVDKVSILIEKVDPAVKTLAMTFFATGLSVGVVLPLMPQIATLLDLSSSQYGVIISSFAFAKMIGNVGSAKLVDKYGKKKMITAGLVTIGLANLQLATFLSYNWILSSRIIVGLGVSALSTAATVFLSDISTSKNRGRTIAPPITAFSVGTAIGPAIGGYLVSELGLYGTFGTVGVAFLGVSVLSNYVLKEPFIPELAKQKEAKEDERKVNEWKEILKNPNIFNTATLHCGYWFVLSGSQMTLMPLLLSNDPFSVTPATLGYIFAAMSCVSVIGTSVSGKLLDKYGKIQLILPAAFTVGTSMLLSSNMSSLETFLPFLFTWVAAGTLLSSGPTAYVADNVPAIKRTKALALLRTAGDIGMLTGSLSAGSLADYFGYSSVISSNGVALMTLTSIIGFRFLFRHIK